MQIITLFYQVKKMMGFVDVNKADKLLKAGLTNSFEPSEKCVNTILAFSKAYRCNKSDAIGQVEYLIN